MREDGENLAGNGRRKPFFSKGAGDPAACRSGPPVGLGGQVGPFKLLGMLGEGGYGIVYLASQEQPIRRQVALKIVKPGMDSRQVIARFEAERQALALLDHPNIAHIYDAGTTPGGRPYFVMEHIEGIPLTAYCDQVELSVVDRLRLFLQVCSAVQHAHQKGIIHRDLKPSNVLVMVADGAPLVKIIDFGVAKALTQPLTEQTLRTEQGQFIGTPDYMSPEQAMMDAANVDTRSDVYSLGVMLYELLTGVLPFDPDSLRAGGVDHMHEVIRNQEPRTPSTRLTALGMPLGEIARRRRTEPRSLVRMLRRELEWIPLKAVRKEPSRRYQSASELANDIESFLKGAPLLAGPESALYRARKFVQRHAGAVAAGVVIAASLLIGLIVSTSMYLEAERMRVVADESRQGAQDSAEAYRQALYRSSISRAYAEYEVGNVAGMLDSLKRCPADLRGWEWRYLRYVSDESILTLHGHDLMVTSVVISPNGRRIVSASLDKTIKVWDMDGGEEVRTLQDGDYFACVALSPDGERLASGGTDRRVKVWSLTTGEQLFSCPYPEDVYAVCFSPDGKQLAAAGAPCIVSTWNARTREELLAIKAHDDRATDIAYSPDGTKIASASFDKTVRIWDAGDGALLKTLCGHKAAVSSVLFSSDGETIFSGDFDGYIRKWDVATGEVLMAFQGHNGEAASLAYAAETRQLASGGADCTIKIWDAATGVSLRTLRGHRQAVNCVAFCPGGTRLVSGGVDGTVKVWSLGIARERRVLTAPGGQVEQVLFSPDGRLLASCGTGGMLCIRDARTGEEKTRMRGHEHPVVSVSFSPDGKRLVSAAFDRMIKVWDVTSGQGLLTLKGLTGQTYSAIFTPDGGHIISGGEDRTVSVRDANSGNLAMAMHGHEHAISSVAVSSDGRYIASASSGQLKFWDASSGKELVTLTVSQQRISAIAFSPDGKYLACAGNSVNLDLPTTPIVEIWDVATGKRREVLQGHSTMVTDVTFSPGGRRIVTTGRDGTVRIWDSETGSEILVLRVWANAWPWLGCNSVAFNPQGTTLAVADYDHIVFFDADRPDGI
jgi:WD40 repeat protein/serine/threonine protein kinase